MTKNVVKLRLWGIAVSALALAGCGGNNPLANFDLDLRSSAGTLDTSAAAQNAGRAPQPDGRGIISYPGYQVAVAKRGDTLQDVADRLGLSAQELSSFNALPENVSLRQGEIIALPRRVREPDIDVATSGPFDVSTLAGNAIDRAESRPGVPSGLEPSRHQVAPGETAFSIARSYNVPVAALAEWNGLGPDLSLRVGQYLLIPTNAAIAPAPATIEEPSGIQVAAVAPPGSGTRAPLPPSASEPLPQEEVTPAAAPPREPVAEPEENTQTAASDTSQLRMPVNGRIIRGFEKGSNEGISIAANAGDAVVAADGGTVAAITRDTDQVPILVIRHEGNLLTVYAGVDEIAVEKGDTVNRGEQIAVVRAASPPFLHFEVREGFDSVDPDPYLQ